MSWRWPGPFWFRLARPVDDPNIHQQFIGSSLRSIFHCIARLNRRIAEKPRRLRIFHAASALSY